MVKVLLYKSLLLSCFCLIGWTVIAQETMEKELYYSYGMVTDGTVSVINKYGDIEVNGWDKDSVGIKIDVQVKGRNEERVETLLNRIQPNITSRSSFIEIETEITEEKSNFFSNLFRTVTQDLNRSNLDIDYTIYLPKKAKLEISNKFGDVLMTDFKGRMNIEIEHGDLRVVGTTDDARVEMKFGKLDAVDDFSGRVTMRNGEINLRHSDYLSIDASGSEIKIGKSEKLVITSSKDDIEIEEVNSINGQLRFSDLEIEIGGEEIILDLHYGSLTMNSFSNGEPSIQLNGNSSEIELNVEAISFELDATLIEGQMRLPKSVSNLESEMLNEKEKRRQVTATYGNASKGEMKIIGKKGTIFLKEND